MRLRIQTTLIFAIILNVFCFGQIENYNSLSQWNTDTTQLHEILKNNFEGGKDNFYKTIYKEIKYPNVANRNCKEGIALIKLSINNSSQEVKTLNKIGSEFDQEIFKVFKKIENFWKSNTKKIDLNISIRFSINPEKENNDKEFTTIQITNHQMGANLICDATCDYRTSEYLIEMAKYSMDYEDYESAILYLKELIRRYPFNKEYQKLYENSWKKIKK